MPKDFIFGGTLRANLRSKTSLKTSSNVTDVRDIKNILKELNIVSDTEDWYQLGTDIKGVWNDEYFGFSVSLSEDGTVMAVGGPEFFSNGVTRIYKLIGTTWMQLGADIVGVGSSDESGESVSLSADGKRVAIGASRATNGVARVYDWNGTEWTLVGSTINGANAGDRFGSSLSLSKDGTTLVVGAPFNDDGGLNAGQVRVFRYNPDTNTWDPRGNTLNGVSRDSFGNSVAISEDGTTMIVGTAQFSGSRNGYVKIYEYNPNTNVWDQKGSTINGSITGEQFGYYVTISNNGTVVAVRSFMGDDGARKGSVRVYIWSGSEWVQRGDTLVGNALFDNFGFSFDLSLDGTIIAIGSSPGLSIGYVRVFKWDGTQWTQVGTDLFGDDLYDGYGSAVSLSANGQRLSIGARNYDFWIGLVRVFDLK